MGATFVRNNLNKRSVGLDLKQPEGRDLFLRLVPRFDVVCENFKAGTMDRLGLGYDVLAERHPARRSTCRCRVSATQQRRRLALPGLARLRLDRRGHVGHLRLPPEPGSRPWANPVGALGDISSALFGTIGILAALRHRDRTGEGQHVDVAMLDAVVAMTDIVTNLWSIGVHDSVEPAVSVILDAFAASDGWFVLQVGAATTSSPGWPSSSAGPSGSTTPASPSRPAGSPTSTTRSGRRSRRGRRADQAEAPAALTAAGITAGPVPDAAGGRSTIPTWLPATCWWRCPAPTTWPSRC